jgi:selenocysteine lyase/cysteine desulfurase
MSEEGTRRGFTRRGLLVAGASTAVAAGGYAAVLPASTIVERLREEHHVVASVTPYVWQYVRFGPSVANSEADVEQALEAVAAVVA